MARREVPEAPPDRASPADSQFAVTAPVTPEGPARVVSAPVTPLPTVNRAVYEILGEHSRGGLGRILRARDTRTGRVVAIKEMLRADDDAVAARFAREAMLTANLQHPAIVPVYEVGRWPDGQPFYAMKLVAGRSLAEAIARCAVAPRSPRAAQPRDRRRRGAGLRARPRRRAPRPQAGQRPGRALRRDRGDRLGPGQGRRRGRRAGRAGRAPPPAAASTVAGTLLGTPAYMPPEQARGETVDERADVYALGAMLYHVLAGAMPYAASSSGDEILEQVRRRPAAAAARDRPGAAGRSRRDRGQGDGARSGRPVRDRRRAGRRSASASRPASWSARTPTRPASCCGGGRAGTARRSRSRPPRPLTLAAVGLYSLQRVRGERDEATAQRGVAEKALVSAEAANREASRSLAALRRELGRQELDAGDPMRALAHLDEAARRSGRIDAGLAYMVGRAADALAPRRWSARSDSRALDRMAVSADGAVASPPGRTASSSAGTSPPAGVSAGWTRTASCSALSRDGRMAAIASTSEVVLWDGQSNRAAAGPCIGCRLLARCRPARRRRRHRRGRDPTGRRCSACAPLERAPRRCHQHRFSAAGDTLVTTGEAGDAALWDAADRPPPARPDLEAATAATCRPRATRRADASS